MDYYIKKKHPSNWYRWSTDTYILVSVIAGGQLWDICGSDIKSSCIHYLFLDIINNKRKTTSGQQNKYDPPPSI